MSHVAPRFSASTATVFKREIEPPPSTSGPIRGKMDCGKQPGTVRGVVARKGSGDLQADWRHGSTAELANDVGLFQKPGAGLSRRGSSVATGLAGG